MPDTISTVQSSRSPLSVSRVTASVSGTDVSVLFSDNGLAELFFDSHGELRLEVYGPSADRPEHYVSSRPWNGVPSELTLLHVRHQAGVSFAEMDTRWTLITAAVLAAKNQEPGIQRKMAQEPFSRFDEMMLQPF